ncbi:hypothetical protein [Mesorhizobium sp. LSHC422A00]|uniref:hypothetical protein n=1 Tax=Mesorhizobium sp. LSHC422A00 TaxID=1287294 RepID=UPI0012EBC729|nr:hypothetical protein [Mesorhizobium sp. LSHC422A00]
MAGTEPRILLAVVSTISSPLTIVDELKHLQGGDVEAAQAYRWSDIVRLPPQMRRLVSRLAARLREKSSSAHIKRFEVGKAYMVRRRVFG